MQPIHVSSNRRFLCKEDGSPFFWLGDTAWELFHRCDRDEVEQYLENRRQKGFNVIKAVVLAEEDGLNVPNSLGDRPLIDNDPTQPNEAYFQHVDHVVESAAKKGLYIGMLPTWGDKVNDVWGVGPVVFNVENAFTYGEFLGKRYRENHNIIWVIGGDRPLYDANNDYGAIFRSMAKGVQSGVDGHTFMTYHPPGGRGSSQQFHHEDWLDMNMWQSGHGGHDIANWDLITNDYQLIPPKPTLDGEPCYEDHPVNPYSREWKPEYGYFDDYDVRKQAYRAVFAGACGHTYGHHSIWQMYTQERYAKTFPNRTWVDALDRPGASHMQYLRQLIQSRPYFTRIPDQGLIASEEGTAGNHIRATRDRDGSYAMIYLPNASQSVNIQMDILSGETVIAQWFNPRDGAYTPIGEFKVTGIQSFTSPDNGPDWVLVLGHKE